MGNCSNLKLFLLLKDCFIIKWQQSHGSTNKLINFDNYIEKTIQLATLNHSESTQTHTYDVIVPVYNGLDALKKCVVTLLKFTDSKHSITFYNDASPDGNIQIYLDELSNQHNQIHVIHNPTNLGYLLNVNNAMQSSKKDIILLNSDTQVTENWLDELDIIANNDEVGVVCPLSDNATILSLEYKYHDKINKLKKLSGQWYPIPTAVGSCMLIKRSIIDEFGGFDEYYHPGYGEECDYSMKLRLAGYNIACAPASFVYHSGSESFGKNSETLKQQHQHLLDLRWPNYSKEIQEFMENNPLRTVEDFLYNCDKTNTVLHAVHGLANLGGVELFTKELLHSLPNFSHTVMAPCSHQIDGQTASTINLSETIRLINYEFNNKKNFNKIANRNADLYQQELDIQFVRQLFYGNHELVHFHSFVGIGSLIWPLICQKLDIPYIVSLHDHYSICTNFSLLTNNYSQYCNKIISSENDNDCLNCLKQMTSYSQYSSKDYLKSRNKIWYQILMHAKKLIVPNEYLDNVLTLKYGEKIKNKTLQIEPYFYPNKPNDAVLNNKDVLNIAFLGTFSFEKGAQLFIEAFKKIGPSKINWHIIGKVHPMYRNQLKPLNIKSIGAYNRNNLTKILSPIDLVVLPSMHPETYGITLTEAWLNHVPVICSDIGAYKQRISHGNNGLLFTSGDYTSLQKCIENTIKDPTLLVSMQKYIVENNCDIQQNIHNVITKTYNQYIKKSNKQKFDNYNFTTRLDKPETSAFQKMQAWLNSEMTYEAESDWKVPEDIDILIVGTQQEQITISLNSCKEYASNSRVIIGNDLPIDVSSIICVIHAGQTLNDNFGNWVDQFQKSNSIIGLADYALIDGHQQPYAPQFLANFDKLTYLNQKSRIGAFLFKKNDQIALCQDGIATTVIDMLISANKTDDIHYFPHLSYYYNDKKWVTQWKNELAIQQLDKTLHTDKDISIVLLTDQKDSLIKPIIDDIKNQKNISINHIYIFSPNQVSSNDMDFISSHYIDFNQPEIFINPVIQRDNSQALLIISDNIALTKINAFQKLNDCLYNYDLQAISPITCNDENLMYGNKLGNGLISGKGILKELQFENKKLPQVTQLLDEDCFLIAKSAWNAVSGFNKVGNIYYRSSQISQNLHKLGMKCALLPLTGIMVDKLPSFCQLPIEDTLENQRNQLIQSNKEFYLNAQHYSKSYTNHENNELDVLFGTFKTPKNLPRILAYANDNWASGFYRVKAPLSALAANNQISCHFLPESRQKRTASYFEINKQETDVLLLHNFLSNNQLHALKQYRAYLEIPMVLSMDDLLTEIPGYNPYSHSNPSNIDSNIKQALTLVDRFIVTTDYLANKFAHLHKDIVVINNLLPHELWFSEDINHTDNLKVRIGWAGAGQHAKDLNWLQPVINATKEHVDWVFYGDKPDFIDSADHSIEFHTHTPLADYHRKLKSLKLDIAIAPLTLNNFNKAKSNLRLLEYGALGITTLCSEIENYNDSPAIKLKNSPEIWIRKIISLANNKEIRRKNGKEMYDWVNENYVLENNLAKWEKALYLKG